MREFDREVSRRDFLKRSAMLGAAGVVSASLRPLFAAGPAGTGGETALDFQPSWIPDVQVGGVYAAIQRGFYKDNKLAVTIRPGGPGILAGAVVDSGGAPVGEMSSSVDLVKAVGQSVRLMAFATVFQRSPAGLAYIKTYPDGRKGKDYSGGPASLKGKRVGITGGTNLPWRVMCAKAKIDPDKDLQVVSTGFDLSPLLDGTVEAFWCFLTNQPGILRARGYEIGTIDSYEWGYRVPGNFLVAKPNYIEDNMDVMKRFLSATRKGWEYCNANPQPVCEEITKILAPKYGTKLELQVAQCKDQVPFMQSELTKKKGLLYVNVEDWESAIKILSDLGELEKPPKIKDFVTTSVLDAI